MRKHPHPLQFARVEGKNGDFSTLIATLDLGIEKGRLSKKQSPGKGYIQDKLLFGCPKTVDITGFFKKFCIATRTKKEDTPLRVFSFFGAAIFACGEYTVTGRISGRYHKKPKPS